MGEIMQDTKYWNAWKTTRESYEKKELDLSNLELVKLPSGICKLHNLEILNINDNQIQELVPAIGQLINLQYLDASNNRIQNIPVELGQLKNLQCLDLSGNQLSKIPIEIEQLSNLEELHLVNNQLKQIPKEIVQLKNLKEINIDGNPLEFPPIEIAKQGLEAIRGYFNLIKLGAHQKLYEAKLIIVGQGGAGKTCLVHKLLNNDYCLTGQEHTTKGINIKEWKYKQSINGALVDFNVNIWDFGGQEIYSTTHQFFLTKRSLYIFVWDGRSEQENSRFEYWLNVVSLLSGDSPVIIVQNKIDERIQEIDQAELKEKYRNIVDFYKVSCLNSIGIEELTGRIKDEIKRLPHIGTDWPKQWADIRKMLESDTKDYFSLSKYLDICSKVNLDEESALVLSTYLHDLGVILHFQEDFILRNTIILKPDWGTDAVYKVIDSTIVVEDRGRFSMKDMNKIWDRDKYPPKKHIELLQLMIKFELCFEMEGKQGEYISPQLLPIERPELVWDYNNSLRFEYWYDFMPDGIITRFIARNHFFIENNTYWKNGVILRIEGTRALIISEPLNRKIKVYIEGGERQGHLAAIIRKDISHIHQTLNNLPTKLMIPCICKKCTITKSTTAISYFDIFDLNRKISKGRTIVECYKNDEDINLEEFGWILSKQRLRDTDSKIDMANNVFVSYSHKDSEWLDRLKVHLKPYERLGEIASWDDTKIRTGDKWREKIEFAIKQSKVAVLLVSPDFLASNFIAENELPPILDAAAKGGIKIVWIAISASAYNVSPIKHYQCANIPSTPLDSLARYEQNNALVKICDKICSLIYP